jgi:hypothetical protein
MRLTSRASVILKGCEELAGERSDTPGNRITKSPDPEGVAQPVL